MLVRHCAHTELMPSDNGPHVMCCHMSCVASCVTSCADAPPASLASASGRLPSAAGGAIWQSYPGSECLLRRRRWLRSRHRAAAGGGPALLQQERGDHVGLLSGTGAAESKAGAGAAAAAAGGGAGAAVLSALGPVAPAPGAMHARDGMALIAVVLCTLLRGTRLTESKVSSAQVSSCAARHELILSVIELTMQSFGNPFHSEASNMAITVAVNSITA
jgi:hypothetical protein